MIEEIKEGSAVQGQAAAAPEVKQQDELPDQQQNMPQHEEAIEQEQMQQHGSAAAQDQQTEQAGTAQQKASQQQQSFHRDVFVEVQVRNITRQGLNLLEQLLTQWATWQHQTYQQGCPLDEQLLSGSLALDVQELHSSGLVGWLDRIAPVAGTGRAQGSATASYEQAEAAPMYDRGMDELLAPPAVPGSGIAMLPGGAEATRRRQMAEARLLADDCGSGPGSVPAKRRRLPNSRCFNCGSYAHGIAQCPRELDQDRVSAAKAERSAAAGGGGAMAALMRQRYFTAAAGGGGKGGKGNPYDGLKPGCISAEVAQAVGMRTLAAPPPWLGRMAVLGLPPKWARPPPAAGIAAADIFTFIMGSEDEADATAGDEIEEEPGSAAVAQQQQQQQHRQENGSASEPADAADGQKQAAGQNGSSQQQLAAVHGAVAGKDGAASSNSTHEERIVDFAAAAAAAAAAAGAGAEQTALVVFPGINGDIPDGADAELWKAELQKAEYVGRMVT